MKDNYFSYSGSYLEKDEDCNTDDPDYCTYCNTYTYSFPYTIKSYNIMVNRNNSHDNKEYYIDKRFSNLFLLTLKEELKGLSDERYHYISSRYHIPNDTKYIQYEYSRRIGL